MVRGLLHLETATEYKEHTEELIKKLRKEADELFGKEHHKELAAKGKTIAELRAQPRYIDACRVVRHLAPVHGYFAAELESRGGAVDEQDKPPSLNPEEAAKVAAEVEDALKKLELPQAEATPTRLPGPGEVGGRPEDADELIHGWEQRVAKLEAKMAEPVGTPPKVSADIDELEGIAQEIVQYRQRLKDMCGYRNKDLKADRGLQRLEERLDTLAGTFLPAEPPSEPAGDVEAEAEELRQWERRLTSRLAQHTQTTLGLKPSAAKEVERLLTEVAELKAELRTQGLTDKEQDKDERVLTRLIRLEELRQFDHRDKKHDKKEKHELEAIRNEVQQLRNKLEAHKRRLRDERGLHQKEVKQDPEVCELEERLATLCRMGGA